MREAWSFGPEHHCSGGDTAGARDEPRQRQSGAAGRGARRTAAVQGADRSRPPDAVQGSDRSCPPLILPKVLSGALGLPLAQPASGGVARFPYQFSQVPGYFIGQPHRPTPHGVQNKPQRELEKCATSTRSESTCGRLSFSSGKARLYGSSLLAPGAAALDCLSTSSSGHSR